MESLPFANIASYKFVDLDRSWIEDLRPALRSQCEDLRLRGTVLLSPEGVNLFLSGQRENISSFRMYITSFGPFEDLSFKVSYSVDHSFRRMLVKVKEEIIPFRDAGIRPSRHTSARVLPSQLKRWLDEKREVVLLDTRNDYEVELGTFRNAINLNLERFRDFPNAIEGLEELKQVPVVTFCTGGIRCEKAAPLMEELGFEKVYQLEGGILGYFEECGGAYWDGECFVFDGRVAVDADLSETDTEFCFRCQHVLRPDDMVGHDYVPGVRCPYCSDVEEHGDVVASKSQLTLHKQ
ncbi:MAG: sulfurtransferase [Rhodothermia bacterium]|nr:sulfurtransferase [Rhodothermia bacterium]